VSHLRYCHRSTNPTSKRANAFVRNGPIAVLLLLSSLSTTRPTNERRFPRLHPNNIRRPHVLLLPPPPCHSGTVSSSTVISCPCSPTPTSPSPRRIAHAQARHSDAKLPTSTTTPTNTITSADRILTRNATRFRQYCGVNTNPRHVCCSAAINAASRTVHPPPTACRLRSPHRPRPPSSYPECHLALCRAQFSSPDYVADAEHVFLPNTLAKRLK
jgi:hypothetical protein